jgi:KipI family sensor histidine kinase inhibitor
VRLRPAGERGLLVEVEDLETVHRLHAALRQLAQPGVVELVPGYRTLLVVADPDRAATLDELAVRLPGLELPPAEAVAGDPVEVPVRYDGEDLDEVARLTGLEVEEVVRRHAAPEYTVAFLGFSPGFPYLVGLDPALRVPRRDTPRTSIPAGSVGLAGDQTGIYPSASPGGWRLIGRTEVTLFDPARDPPALLAPGGRLRFTVAR